MFLLSFALFGQFSPLYMTGFQKNTQDKRLLLEQLVESQAVTGKPVYKLPEEGC
jgi:hypothetical protein